MKKQNRCLFVTQELPLRFCLTALGRASGDIKLIDADGTRWNCTVSHDESDPSNCRISRSWVRVHTMKNFRMGHTIMFGVTIPNSDALYFIES